MNTSRLHSRRGSAMIVALIISAVVAISLASYIRLGVSSQRISNRALYNNAAMNLAENGLEEAMYSINKMVADDTYNWSGWTNNGTSGTSAAWRRFPSNNGTYSFDQNAKGYVRVYVYNYLGTSAPKIVTRSTINLGGAASAPIEKWVEVTLSKTSKFANGLVAKDTILFKGNNATVDSWNSDPTSNGSFIPFSDSVKKDNGSVGSVSIAVDSVLVQNADIWGYVSTNNADDPTDNVGNNGSILGSTSVNDGTWKKTNVDPTRVSTQFSANFDPVTAPANTTNIGSIAAVATYGTAGSATTITCTDITLSGNSKIITFQGDVTLIITAGENAQAIKITGNGSGITVAANSSLKIYTAGNIDLTGQGITNTSGAPKNVQIYGTSTSTTSDQDIKIAGGGSFSGVIYAPNGSVELKGDGSMWGSVVAEDIMLTGNANFHYDESLGELGTGNPFRVSKWKELTTATDRTTYSPKLSF